MFLNLYRMIERRHVSPGFLPVIAMVAVLALGSGDIEAKLRPVTAFVRAAASDSSTTQPATDPAASGAVEASVVAEGEVIPVVFVPASAPDTGTLVPSGNEPKEIGTIGVDMKVSLAPPPRDMTGLAASVQQLIASSGASVGVTVIELGGQQPATWSVNGGGVFTAASTYKLAALMLEAQNIAAGRTDPNGVVCYDDNDYEDGWFADYAPGECFTRTELARRAGQYSDNTAGHMLVRDIGGAGVLDAWAASLGATNSAFFVGNTTTSADLAALWLAEAQGRLGGAAAQAWLYPLLTNTRTENGIPSGVAGVVVVHKTGTIDQVDNDAALVTNGPAGAYILVVMTDGLGGPQGWQLIAGISAGVSQFEASRTVSS
jgi:beta-lactamase class A